MDSSWVPQRVAMREEHIHRIVKTTSYTVDFAWKWDIYIWVCLKMCDRELATMASTLEYAQKMNGFDWGRVSAE